MRTLTSRKSKRERTLKAVLFIALVLELLAAVPFFVDEMQRRANAEFSVDCVLCFLFAIANVSFLVSLMFSLWNRVFIRIALLILICFGMLSNLILLLRAHEMKSVRDSLDPNMIVVYFAYWDWFQRLEIVVVVATIAAIGAFLIALLSLRRTGVNVTFPL